MIKGKHVYVALYAHMYEHEVDVVGVYESYVSAVGDLARKYPAFVTLPRHADEVVGTWEWEDDHAQTTLVIHRKRVQ